MSLYKINSSCEAIFDSYWNLQFEVIQVIKIISRNILGFCIAITLQKSNVQYLEYNLINDIGVFQNVSILVFS